MYPLPALTWEGAAFVTALFCATEARLIIIITRLPSANRLISLSINELVVKISLK
jgi:hypothetical protein